VTGTCAITIQGVNPKGVFYVPGLQQYDTRFIAFEPAKFFRMAELKFDEGNKETALRRLEEGGAVLVAKEFKTARGLGVGDKVTLSAEGKDYTFDIVGVVTSPGLEIVNEFFDIGETYMQQSVSAVFGSRKDLKEKFGNDAINLIQIAIDQKADDATVMKEARRVGGVIDAGSGRQIKVEIGKFLSGALLVFSVVAVSAMLVACFGVANLIIAGIQARQFEFGVLRAIGAQKGLLARLVLGEALIIAIAACTLGTVMGAHAAWGGQQMNARIIGLELRNWTPPVGATAAGWGVLIMITLAAAGPAAWRLMRREPRELLASVRG
jgi:putative ABC transport system permease protein